MRYLYQRFLVIFFLALSLNVLIGTRAYCLNRSSSGLQTSAVNNVIKVVIDDNYPPYVFKDSAGRVQGILIDEWKLFEKKTGIKIIIDVMDWSKALKLMKQGKYDVIDTIFYNKERAKLYDFTKAYAKIDVPIFFNKNISGISDVESLNGFTIAAKTGDNCIDFLKNYGITDIKEFNSYESIIKAASEHKISVFVVDKPPALYYMYKLQIQDQFNYSAPLYSGEFHRAVKKGNIKLLKFVESGFGKITTSEYASIEKKWEGSSPNTSEFIKNILIITLIIVLILIFFIIWNSTLQQKVKQKTYELSQKVYELEISEERVSAMLEAIPDIFFLIDKDGVFIDYHGAKDFDTYVPAEFFLGKSVYDIFPKELSQQFYDSIKKTLVSGEPHTEEYSLDTTNGIGYYEARLVLCGKDCVIGIVRDMTHKKKAEERIREMSIKDSLTGLFNRNFFEEKLKILQTTKFNSVAVVECDLDGLKFINDTLGHGVGDQYLSEVAQKLTNVFTNNSIIARIGGDEFVIIMIDKTEKEVEDKCNDFKLVLLNTNKLENAVPLSVSLGYVHSNNMDANLNDLLREADNRMYREKLHKRQSMKSEMIQTLKKMLEARDFITEGHGDRMEKTAKYLAIAIGIPENKLADIMLLAQFHDIGKVGISDSILFKPSRLTDEEYEIMKTHSDIGYRIAQTSIDLMPITEGILKHHEHWDGGGYPFGISGNNIPVECRILSIVDAYDAMVNDRPYRRGMSKEKAVQELERCSGTQFDPEILKKFIELLNSNSI